jgi:predicted Zn-dependent protease
VVAVSAGVVSSVRSESELAYVVAHELSHFHLGHMDALVTRQLQTECELRHAFSGERAPGLPLQNAGAVGAALASGFSPPRDEIAVDAEAVRLVIAAGWDPRDALAVTERLTPIAHDAGKPGERRTQLQARVDAWRPP